jgi:beta-lactamase class A
MAMVMFAVATMISAVFNSSVASEFHAVDQINDATLQQMLQSKLKQNNRMKRLIDNKKLSVCLIDMQHESPRSASINGDHMMYAASLPKIAILFAAYASLEDGSLIETPEIRKDLARMIRVSSNSAATRMIDRIGFDKIQALLQDPKYKFYDKQAGGGLWVGKRYASKGVRRGDPLYNISHGATANQVCRFFHMLSKEELINQARSQQMLSDLGTPALHHKFVSQIDLLAPKAAVYRKSGSWRTWHADAIMVKGVGWRDYILVGLVESGNGEQVIRELLTTVDGLIKPPASK